jgi:hypothetical protein
MNEDYLLFLDNLLLTPYNLTNFIDFLIKQILKYYEI